MRNSTQFGSSGGSIVVEFAIIMPFILALIFSIVDISRIFLSKSYATDIVLSLSNFYRYETPPEALKAVSLSQVQSRANAFAENFAGGLSNVNDISISAATYRNISDLLTGIEQKNHGLLGGMGDIVKYTLHYTVTPLTPFADYFYPSDTFVRTVTLISKNGN